MTGLKQLFLSYAGPPAGIGKLSRLHRLNQFWVRGSHEGSSSSSSSNIWELKDLNQLHGSLAIHNLNMVTSREEAASAQLDQKTSLTFLMLYWSSTDIQGEWKETTSEDVLQALRPCTTLPQLEIIGYPGRTVPTWLIFSGLRELFLRNWDGCTNLPALGNLPELRRLEIRSMPKVRRVGAEWFGSNHGFPKLETLQFQDMAKWEEWDNSLEEKFLFTFPCLNQLTIYSCPKLRSLPQIFSTISPQRIYVDDDCSRLSNWLGILEPCIVTLGPSISAEWVTRMPSLPNLEHLTIRGDDGVSELSNRLVMSGALKTLKIRNCPNLKSFPQEMTSLKQLQTLSIYDCPKLKETCNKERA